MIQYYRMVIALLVYTLAACSAQPPQLNYLTTDAVVLAMGDSITYGTGAAESHSYPEILEQLSGRKIINAGVPGELSSEGAKRLPGLLDEYQPQLLILCHGGNDILRRRPMTSLVNNLRSMIEAAQQRGIDVLLIGVPEFSLLLLDSAAFYEELAEEYNVHAELDILPEIESNELLKSDRVHPNAEGYRHLAEAIHNKLVDSGAL